MLPLVLAPVLVGLSMLVQRPLSRWLQVRGSVWPLLPFGPEVRWRHRLAIRGAGLLFTFLLVLGALFLQTRREQRLTARVTVGEGMAAAQAGVLSGDLITAVDGVEVGDFSALHEQVLEGGPNKRLSILRGGQPLELTVTLRDGLLGVKAEGETRESASGEALGKAARALITFPVTYVRLTHRALGKAPASDPEPARPARTVDSATWALALSISLMFSWWLTLGVELAALALGLVLQRGADARRSGATRSTDA